MKIQIHAPNDYTTLSDLKSVAMALWLTIKRSSILLIWQTKLYYFSPIIYYLRGKHTFYYFHSVFGYFILLYFGIVKMRELKIQVELEIQVKFGHNVAKRCMFCGWLQYINEVNALVMKAKLKTQNLRYQFCAENIVENNMSSPFLIRQHFSFQSIRRMALECIWSCSVNVKS